MTVDEFFVYSPNNMTDPGPSNNLPILNKSNEVALLNLMERTGYTIIQENGQRKYGGPPPDWQGQPPPKGSEVFVGKIPRDCFEDELVPVFEKIGKIYEFRLMMDFSGSNRGYAFVMYSHPAEAQKAVKQLNNFEIRKGKYLGVVKSVDNCRLFVGGIPKTKTKEEILAEMAKVTEGVVNVILYSSVTDKTKSRGFAFVEYENHRAAAMARRKLIPGKIQLWGHEIAVDWAEPEPEVDEDTMSKVTVLYIRNLMLNTTEDQIRDAFNEVCEGTVEKVKKLRDFAFVHFRTREDAENALEIKNETDLDGSIIEVTWAKPVDKGFSRYGGKGRSHSYANNIPQSVPFAQYEPVTSPYTPFSPTSIPQPTTRGNASGLHSPVRGRGRGAAGIRGGRGFAGGSNYMTRGYPGRRPTEFFPQYYDIQAGMELLPFNTLFIKNKTPLQKCAKKNNWGEPIYQALTTVQRDGGGDVQVYVYKVVIMPSFPVQYNAFQPQKLLRNADEAKQYAAEYVLNQLGVSIDTYEHGGYYDNAANYQVTAPQMY
uniref:RRM domain-containing protein n=1 Tax=Strigamia maritima TaxID=126957 RepID=T1J1J1_STRMM